MLVPDKQDYYLESNMSASNKQIYIPFVNIKGAFMEEIGNDKERIMYPGTSFDISLSAEDFSDPEEYHTTWINITRAVKTKLNKDASGRTS